MRIQNLNLKNKLTLMVAMLLVGCGKTQLNNNQIIKIEPLIENHSIKHHEICHMSDVCIDNEKLLKNLYGGGVKFVDSNEVEVNGSGVAKVIYSSKFTYKNDSYALFISGFNEYDKNGEIPSCHACGQQMGLAVFRFNVEKRLWEEFSLNNNVGNFGSYGEINLGAVKNSALSLYDITKNNFLLTFNQGYMGQGYISEWVELISISKGNSEFSSRKIGWIRIAETNCSGNQSDNLDWSSTRDLTYNDKSPYPDVHLNISYKSVACDDKNSKTVGSKKQVYQYDVVKNAYLEIKH